MIDYRRLGAAVVCAAAMLAGMPAGAAEGLEATVTGAVSAEIRGEGHFHCQAHGRKRFAMIASDHGDGMPSIRFYLKARPAPRPGRYDIYNLGAEGTGNGRLPPVRVAVPTPSGARRFEAEPRGRLVIEEVSFGPDAPMQGRFDITVGDDGERVSAEGRFDFRTGPRFRTSCAPSG